MAFLGGAECSTAANPLSQFSKHIQDDKSLQRDRLVGRSNGLQDGIRRQMPMGGQDKMMDEFMQTNSQLPPTAAAAPFAMDHMRRELDSMRQVPQRNGSPRWAAEFDPGLEENARMGPVYNGARASSFSSAEFERFQHMQPRATSPLGTSATGMTGYQRPFGMNYGMGGMGMMGMGSMGMMQPGMMSQQAPIEGKGKGRMIELDDKDWEAQFAQLESERTENLDMLDEEANKAMEEELGGIDRSVSHTTDMLGDFETAWQKIKAETVLDNRELSENPFGEFDPNEFKDWENFDGLGLHGASRDPQLGDYMFEEENIFSNVTNPFEEGVRIMNEGGNLSLAALAFEAAVQKDQMHVEAWTRLGSVQAQNEKETPAIRALERAITLDPGNLDALMGLAVSYTNEGYETTAYRTLERWLASKYPAIVDKSPGNDLDAAINADLGITSRQHLHDRVTDLFIRAAQLSPSAEQMDPDVQVGLGVLFYGAEEYEKAVDCFSSALASTEQGTTNNPLQMPLLWNRLGATLANSGRSEEAIDAYERALSLNPNFVRARYNLGVSCINIGCYAEAAQHLLGALAMHKVVEKEGREKAREIVGDAAGGDELINGMILQNQSTNLYDTLRRVFSQMGRRDLVDKVVTGMDVDIFRGEFEF